MFLRADQLCISDKVKNSNGLKSIEFIQETSVLPIRITFLDNSYDRCDIDELIEIENQRIF